MKHEWKKAEKNLYLPKTTPEFINVPEMKFFTVSGSGNPNDQSFGEYIGVLYSLSYGVKMSIKGGFAPAGYFEYSVYPLEGVWDLKPEAKINPAEKLDKNSLVFNLMIRQPEFVSVEFANEVIERTKKKKPHPLLSEVKFDIFYEGKCAQILHVGSYDDEPASFKKIEDFLKAHQVERESKIHREIYLSDARKTVAEKLKTILRVKVKS